MECDNASTSLSSLLPGDAAPLYFVPIPQQHSISEIGAMLSPFTGTKTDNVQVDQWLHSFDLYASFKEMSDSTKLRLFKIMMKGEAEIWLRTLPDNKANDFARLLQAFRERYAATPNDRFKRVIEIFECKQSATESVDVYIARLQLSAQNLNIPEEYFNQALVNGLHQDLKRRVLETEASDLTQIRKIAKAAEVAREQVDKPEAKFEMVSQQLKEMMSQFKEAMTAQSKRTESASRQITFEQMAVESSDRFDSPRQATQSIKPFQQPKTNVRKPMQQGCNRCGRKSGHPNPLFCPMLTQECFSCGKRGHASKVCRTKATPYQKRFGLTSYRSRQSDDDLNRPKARSAYCNATVTKNLKEERFISIKIHGIKTRCLVDTGSHFSVLDRNIAERLRLTIQPITEHNEVTLIAANGSQLEIVGTTETLLDISGLQILHEFYIAETLAQQAVLGRLFLEDASAVIDFRNQTITLSDILQVPLQHKIHKDQFVRAKESFCIKPKEEVLLPVKCARKFNNQTIVLTPVPGEQFRRFAIANSLCEVKRNQTVCRLFNCTNECLVICANQKIAHAETFNDFSNCLAISDIQSTRKESAEVNPSEQVDEATLNAFANEYKFDINPQLTPDLRIKLLTVLYKRKDAFARSINDLKTYNKEQFEVKLKSDRPLLQRQFRHKPQHARILQKIIDSWQQAGIAEESKNLYYRNAIFLVPKGSLKTAKDPENIEHWRPVIDLRGLNERCEKLVTFTPSTSDLIHEVTKFSESVPHQRSSWFSSCDLLSGYYQLGLKEGLSRECFTFVSPSGQNMCLTRIPMGYVNAPHLFNSVMTKIMSPLRATNAFCCYVDDCLIHSRSAEEHLLRLDEFLSILIRHDLKCSVKKSTFMQNEIRFLGVNITPEGIKPPAELTRALDKLQTMKLNSKKSIQKLLGFLNFWRFHIKNLAQRTHSLRQLIKKDTAFQVTTECEKERLDVLSDLRTASPLLPINPSQDIWLLVDSSAHGYGASICQVEPQAVDSYDPQKELSHIRKGQARLRPIMHLSWALTPAQSKYASCALELHGLFRCLSSLEHLFTGRRVHVVSDNLGVHAFKTLRLTNIREKRIMAYLQQFELIIHYCPGEQHKSADCLSRLPEELPQGEKVQWSKSTQEDDQLIDDYLFNINSVAAEMQSQPTAETGERQWAVYLINGEPNDNIACSKARSTNGSSKVSVNDKPNNKKVQTAREADPTRNVVSHNPTKSAGTTGQLPPGRLQASSNLNAGSAPFMPRNVDVVLSNQFLNFDSQRSRNTVSSQYSEETQLKQQGLSTPTTHITSQSITHAPYANSNLVQVIDAARRVRNQPVSPQAAVNPQQSENSNAPESTLSRLTVTNLPKILSSDYDCDPEFGDLWKYLYADVLSGDRTRDHRTAILAPLFTIENGQLFRLSEPRSKKRSADGAIRKVLAIPKNFQQPLLINLHETHGHAGGQRLFEAARLSTYFKNLYAACFEVAKSCTLCQQVKVDQRRQVPELHSTPIFGPGEVFYMDHKVLPKKVQNYTAILCFCDAFSGFTHFEMVTDQSAQQTADVIIKKILPLHPTIRGLISDKHKGFMSNLMKNLTQKVLGWKHFSSSSYCPQSHGQIEVTIKTLSVLLNLLANSDQEIPQVLPLAELISRCSISKPRGYSPMEILMGHQPELSLLGQAIERDEPIPTTDQYVTWLKEKLKRVHKDVTANLSAARASQKAEFDKRNRVIPTPDWSVGDLVWLERKQPRPKSDRILSHKRYGDRPFYITKIVQRAESVDPNQGNYPSLEHTAIAPAYQLTDSVTGHVLRNLVPSRRLKRRHDKARLDKLCPSSLSQKRTAVGTPNTQQNSNEQRSADRPAQDSQQSLTDEPSMANAENANMQPTSWETAKCIVRKRTVQGKVQFLVKFQNNECWWCDDENVSAELKRRFFLKKANETNRRRRAARLQLRDT